MLTRIQHFAIVSENLVREAKFYESVFDMKRSKPGSEEEQKAIRTNYAVSISDGYVGVSNGVYYGPHRDPWFRDDPWMDGHRWYGGPRVDTSIGIYIHPPRFRR